MDIDRFSSLITVCSPVLILPDKFCFMSDFLLITKAFKFFISGIRRRDIPPGVGDSSSALRKGRYRRPAGGGAGHGRRRARVHLRQRVPRYIPVSKVLRPASISAISNHQPTLRRLKREPTKYMLSSNYE